MLAFDGAESLDALFSARRAFASFESVFAVWVGVASEAQAAEARRAFPSAVVAVEPDAGRRAQQRRAFLERARPALVVDVDGRLAFLWRGDYLGEMRALLDAGAEQVCFNHGQLTGLAQLGAPAPRRLMSGMVRFSQRDRLELGAPAAWLPRVACELPDPK